MMLTNAVLSAFMLTGGVRSYIESAYMSTTGKFVYTNPVAEQYLDLGLQLGDYGRIRTDAWLFSDISGTRQHVHRRNFSCYEGTLIYGYDWALDAERRWSVDTNGGILWDWLGGYHSYAGIPIGWYAFQSLKNPYLIPYWNALGMFDGCDRSMRIRFGLQHDWQATETLTLSPYTDVTWGDSTRYRINYGENPEQSLCGGALMFSTVGVISRWYFYERWYLWGRCRYMFVVDGQARRLLKNRTDARQVVDYPFFGIGVGVRF